MDYWTNSAGGCLPACVASLVGVHPGDLPQTDQVAEMDDYLRAAFGRTLEPVYGTTVDDLPAGHWVALEGRSANVAHAVLARRSEAVHDPAGGTPTHLWGNLARRHNRELPLGYRLVAA